MSIYYSLKLEVIIYYFSTK